MDDIADKKFHILVIEDSHTLARALEKKLTFSGYKVSVTYDGATGVGDALRLHPDLVLLDVRMPDMDGLDLLEELRKDEWGRTAKVIILTNYNDEEHKKRAHNLGVHSYITKASINLSDLVNEIERILNAK